MSTALIIGWDAADQGEIDLHAWREARSGYCRHLEARDESYRYHLREGLHFARCIVRCTTATVSSWGSSDVLVAVMGCYVR